MQAKQAFVTGGSGFLGQRLIRTLVERGWTVRALARSDASAKTVEQQGATATRGDLDDVAAMTSGMENCSAVFHSAAKVSLWGAWRDFERETIQGTRNVIAAARAARVPRLVHVSTEAVLADGQAIIDADESRPLPVRPNGQYPRSKGIAERLVQEANDATLTTVVCRPRFIWGQGDTTVLPKMTAAMKAGQWIWFGDPDHPTSTCHVANVVHGLILAAERGRGGEVYFLTDGPPVAFASFLTTMAAAGGVTPSGRQAPIWLADGIAALAETVWRAFGITNREPPLTRTAVNLFFRQVTVSDAKARRELGYLPIFSIEDGMKEIEGRRT